MIAVDTDARLRIDAAIDASLTRLSARAATRGESAAALASAIERAAAGGKRLRPALVVRAFEAFGGNRTATPALWQVAAAFELLHTAFVVHDDVIDRDTARRGVPNVGGEFRARARDRGAAPAACAIVGDAAAILAGDLLLHEVSRLIATADLPGDVRDTLLDVLDEAVLVSAVGELADVENAADADVPAATALLGAAHDKTAVYSFRAPLAAGAILAGADAAAQAAVAEASAQLGLAFQLVDDLIGTFGTRAQAGRTPGADLREGKRTPLIAFARDTASWPQVSSALALAHTGPIAVRRAQRELTASGARTRMVELIAETLEQSRRTTEALPAGARELMDALTDAIRGRIP
ncbi:polyprenyl synthetase family protein [Microbacterium telephonicum]|uniref:Geranylgeranyl diphosphate synthase type II n=1 Tax=Microbacterium telephonicum TaxID=1714841 RepID=A0A498C3E3_9MICO|nr:polyprenyl synthetase family protein [Microbacterium telephonicum]RLK49116.1 geranylgeranyl diphosphate synthase type II [Microbacterium telephonicum]